jgi:methionine-R-sulfoxide reductase
MNMPPLTPEEKRVIIDKGTEMPFTGKYDTTFDKGMYLCRQCGTPLYTSEDKFDSGCGWPAFDQEIEGAVTHVPVKGADWAEITCTNCGGHLGHVFEDGPPPTGLRYCINGVILDFDAK